MNISWILIIGKFKCSIYHSLASLKGLMSGIYYNPFFHDIIYIERNSI